MLTIAVNVAISLVVIALIGVIGFVAAKIGKVIGILVAFLLKGSAVVLVCTMVYFIYCFVTRIM